MEKVQRETTDTITWQQRAGTEVVRLLPLLPLLAACALLLPMLLGWHSFVVLSGSMEPVYHIGSLLYVCPATPGQVHPGQVITFTGHTGDPVTHRVVAVDATNGRWVTKGDANRSTDPLPVPFGALLGRAVFAVPLLGYLSLFTHSAGGMVLLGLVLAVATGLALAKPKQRAKETQEGSI